AAERDRGGAGEVGTGQRDAGAAGDRAGRRGHGGEGRGGEVVVDDRPRCLAVGDGGADDVGDVDEEALVGLERGVAVDGHREVVGAAAGRDGLAGERAGEVIAVGHGRGVVGGGDVEGHPARTGRGVERDREGEAGGPGIALGERHVADRQPGRLEGERAGEGCTAARGGDRDVDRAGGMGRGDRGDLGGAVDREAGRRRAAERDRGGTGKVGTGQRDAGAAGDRSGRRGDGGEGRGGGGAGDEDRVALGGGPVLGGDHEGDRGVADRERDRGRGGARGEWGAVEHDGGAGIAGGRRDGDRAGGVGQIERIAGGGGSERGIERAAAHREAGQGRIAGGRHLEGDRAGEGCTAARGGDRDVDRAGGMGRGDRGDLGGAVDREAGRRRAAERDRGGTGKVGTGQRDAGAAGDRSGRSEERRVRR